MILVPFMYCCIDIGLPELCANKIIGQSTKLHVNCDCKLPSYDEMLFKVKDPLAKEDCPIASSCFHPQPFHHCLLTTNNFAIANEELGVGGYMLSMSMSCHVAGTGRIYTGC